MAYRKRYGRWCGDEPGYDLLSEGRLRNRTANAVFRVSQNPDASRRDSINDQDRAYDGWLPRAGCLPGVRWADDDRSASGLNPSVRREDFIRALDAIKAGRHDDELLWLWAVDRLTRGDYSFVDLMDLFIAHGIVLIENTRPLNPANDDDYDYLEERNRQARAQPKRTSKDVKRRKATAALEGRPAVRPLYGYRRVYEADEHGQTVFIGGKPVIKGDVPSELGKDGSPVPGTPAAVVAEIMDRIGALETATVIRDDFEDRRIPSPRFPLKCTTCGKPTGKEHACPDGHEQDLCRWSTSTIRDIAGNPGYLGYRVHHVESYRPGEREKYVLPGVTAWWPPLPGLTREKWDNVQVVLTARSGKRLRNGGKGAPRFLLSTIARCAHCGAAMSGSPPNAWHPAALYSCNARGCVTILADWLDNWVQEILCNWLGEIGVSTRLWSRRDSEDETVRAARKELDRHTRELAELEASMENGTWEGTDAGYGRAERNHLNHIERADAIVRRAEKHASATLKNLLGPGALDRWMALKTADLNAARQVLTEVATIYVRRAPRRGGIVARGSDADRVEWVWNIGDQARPAPALLDDGESRAERRQARREVRETVTGLLLAGPDRADTWIGAEAKCDYHLVQRVRRELMQAGQITEPGYRRSATGKRLSVHHGSGLDTGPLEDDIEKLVRSREETRSADVTAALGIASPTANNNLARLARAGRIRRAQRGVYVPA